MRVPHNYTHFKPTVITPFNFQVAGTKPKICKEQKSMCDPSDLPSGDPVYCCSSQPRSHHGHPCPFSTTAKSMIRPHYEIVPFTSL